MISSKTICIYQSIMSSMLTNYLFIVCSFIIKIAKDLSWLIYCPSQYDFYAVVCVIDLYFLTCRICPWAAATDFIFLDVFTLLGIDQTQLIRRMTTQYVWGFAIFQSALMSLAITLIAYLLGVRGDLLLAIAGLSATAPLFGTGAIGMQLVLMPC